MDEIQAFVLSNAYAVYAGSLILGAVLHWVQKAKKGEATWNVWDYWVAESPGYTMGTFGALVGAIWVVVGTDALAGMNWQMIVASAFTLGFAIDSAVAPSANLPVIGGTKQGGFIRLSMLPWLIAIALLVGCVPTGVLKPEPLTSPALTEQETAAVMAYRIAHGTVREASGAVTLAHEYISRKAGPCARVQSPKCSALKIKLNALRDKVTAKELEVERARQMLAMNELLTAKTSAQQIKDTLLLIQREIFDLQ